MGALYIRRVSGSSRMGALSIGSSIDWFHKQNRFRAIRAVRDAVASNDRSVREAAVHVTRSWLMNWKHALSSWSVFEIEEAKRIFASRTYRTELKRQVTTERSYSKT